MLAQELRVESKNNEVCERLKEVFREYPKKQYGEDERLVIGTDVTLETRDKVNLYLNDIENITNRKMTSEQRELITDYINHNKIYRLDKEEHEQHRKRFNAKRKLLRREWEKKTGQAWPKYQEDVYQNGKIYRMRGQCYDAHHIIELSFGGPNVWYNLFPAASPNEHQYGIHDDYSIGTEIFGPIDKRYRNKKRDFKNLTLKQDVDDKYKEEAKEKEKSKKPKEKIIKISEHVIRILKERFKKW